MWNVFVLTHHIRFLDANGADGEALQLSSRQQSDVAIVDVLQL